MNSKVTYIPENLDLELLLKNNEPEFKPWHIDNFKYILGLLYEIPTRKKDIYDKENCYVPINGKILQSIIHKYPDYIAYLRETNVIKCDEQYIPHEKSTGYQFTHWYDGKPKKAIISKYTLLKRLNKHEEQTTQAKKDYKYLYKWFNPSLKIDVEAAQNYLDKTLQENIDNGIKNAKYKYSSSMTAVDKLDRHDYWFHIDPNIGRCHTNLTNIPSKLRDFITYDGQQLVSVDLKNSQPLISGVLCNPMFYTSSTKEDKFYKVDKILKSKRPIASLLSKRIQRIENYIMVVENQQPLDGIGFEEYLADVQNGIIYERFNEELFHHTSIQLKGKMEIKKAFFKTFFSGNSFYGQEEAFSKRVFNAMYPDVYKLFCLYKRSDNSILARVLQTIESHMFLDVSAKQIQAEHPYLPIYTIHDSIVCPVGYERYVEQVIREVITACIQMDPILKFEYWGKEPNSLLNTIAA